MGFFEEERNYNGRKGKTRKWENKKRGMKWKNKLLLNIKERE